MVYDVSCNVDGCPFADRNIDTIDEVYDLQETHTEEYGEHHSLEFERVEAEAAADGEDDD